MKNSKKIISAGHRDEARATLPPGPQDGASAADLDDPLDDTGAGPGRDEVREFRVDPAGHGQRLDQWLARNLVEFSRSYLRQLIDDGLVASDDAAVPKPARRVKAGEQLRITLRPTPASDAYRAEPVAFGIVHEDEHILVVDKPVGLVVHPAAGNWSGTLLNGLLFRDAAARTLPRAGIVHRLDKDTSGLMVVARSRAAMDALVRQIAARDVSRRYIALGWRGWSGPAQRLVDAAIGRDPRNRLRMAVLDPQRHPAREAATDLALLDGSDTHCCVQASLRTGRTHQIRVHMAHIGHPLVGDSLYGGAAAFGLERQALHAWRLAFRHPVTDEPLAFESPLPPDITSALDQAGLSYNRALQ